MSVYNETCPTDDYEHEDDFNTMLAGWFSVSGDMDDFIFYGDTSPSRSEK